MQDTPPEAVVVHTQGQVSSTHMVLLLPAGAAAVQDCWQHMLGRVQQAAVYVSLGWPWQLALCCCDEPRETYTAASGCTPVLVDWGDPLIVLCHPNLSTPTCVPPLSFGHSSPWSGVTQAQRPLMPAESCNLYLYLYPPNTSPPNTPPRAASSSGRGCRSTPTLGEPTTMPAASPPPAPCHWRGAGWCRRRCRNWRGCAAGGGCG